MSAQRGGLAAMAVVVGATMLATWALGWLGVVLVAFAAAAAGEHRQVPRVPPLRIGLAGTLAWGGLLLLQAAAGAAALRATIAAFGAATAVPGALFIVATLLLPLVLAWPAAVLGRTAGLLLAGEGTDRRRFVASYGGEAAGASRSRTLR